jgi:Putative beta-barrel porin 2
VNSTVFRTIRPSGVAQAVAVFLIALSAGSRLIAQDFVNVRLAVADTVGTTPLAATDQSTDVAIEEIPPLPVAASDSGLESTPATSIDSGIPRRFHYKFRLNVRAVYDDNINLSNDANRVSDLYTTIEPAVMLGFGDTDSRIENYIRLDYLPAVFLFADHSENNSVQHVARLEGQYRINRLTLNMSQMVQIMDGVDVQTQGNLGDLDQQVNLDVAGRTRFNIYTTLVHASYYLTGKTFLSGGANYTALDYTSLISSETFSGNFFLNYHYSPKVVVGLGGTAGRNWVDEPNPDQTFEQVNLRMSYQATGKIDFAATAGVEFRQFEGDMRDQYVSPVFEGRLNYTPFDGTKIFLTANRRTLNSAVLAAQNYAVTNITVGMQQRLLTRFFVGVNAGYENADYFSTIGSTAPERDDDYFFVQPSMGVRVTRFWTVGAYYLHRQNSSAFDEFSFHDNQVGFRSSAEF